MLNYLANILVLAVLIGLSAFFSGNELAFLSVPQVRLHSLVEKNVHGAKTFARLRSKRRKVIISILIWNNIANIAASAVATSFTINLFGDYGIGIAVGVMSFLILTFGEIIPKSLAISHAEKMALMFSRTLEFFYLIAYPLVVIFEMITKLVPGTNIRAISMDRFTEADVISAIKMGAMHKGISKKEKKTMENVLVFNDVLVSKVMTPKRRVVFLPSEMAVYEAHKKAALSGYSRFPVTDRNKKVLGVVSIKMLSKALHETPDFNVGKLCLKPIVLRANTKLHNALEMLQFVGRNLAVVVDDKKKFVGVVTVEDLVEQLVGEIH